MHSSNKTVPVEYLSGEKSKVVIARLTIEQLYRAVELMGAVKSVDLIEMATGLERAKVNELTDESFAALSKEVVGANFQRAAKLAASDPILGMSMMPLFDRLGPALGLANGLISTASSPAPAPASAGLGARPADTPSSSSTPSSPNSSATAPAAT